MLAAVRELLLNEGMPADEFGAWLPHLPQSLLDAWSVSRDPSMAQRVFAADLAAARGSGLPAALGRSAVERGITPSLAMELWKLGRSQSTYQIVSLAHFKTRHRRHKIVATAEGVKAYLEAADQEVHDWLASPIPRERILVYIRAGEPLSRATAVHEPRVASGMGIADVELLAALAPPLDVEQLDDGPDPAVRS